MTDQRIKALVIGLGQVGSRFDEDPKRTTIWTHVGAYLSRPDDFYLCGAVEPGSDAVQAFSSRCPDIPVYACVADTPDTLNPDVVSICTPMHTHLKAVEEIFARFTPKIIWCEKPLDHDLQSAKKIVTLCRERGVKLIVSHVRRWLPLWQRTRQLMNDGAVGEIVSIRIALPNRIYSIGSHALDLLEFLGGHVTSASALEVPMLREDDEPAVPAMVLFESGAYGIYQVTGFKENLVVEAEVIGSTGRMVIDEQQESLRIEEFRTSDNYASYKRLVERQTSNVAGFSNASPFCNIVDEIDQIYHGKILRPTCSGEDAYRVQKLIDHVVRINTGANLGED